MNDIIIDAKEYLTGPISKRAHKLWQKLEDSTQEYKKAYFAMIIQECEYNQTTNKPRDSAKDKKGKKLVRKKTDKELKLLEYFLEQDPEWSRTTVATAAKVLDLSCYQVYKWGYDRKNRKDVRTDGWFVKDVEVSKDILDKINEIQDKSHQNAVVNLNKEVDELLIGSSKYKNLDENWTEFLVDEFNFLSDQACVGESSDDSSDKPAKILRKRVAKVFSVKKVHKRSKNANLELSESAHDHIWQGWQLQNCWNSSNLNQDIFENANKESKLQDADVNDRVSDITNDKSFASGGTKNDQSERLLQFCDTTPFVR